MREGWLKSSMVLGRRPTVEVNPILQLLILCFSFVSMCFHPLYKKLAMYTRLNLLIISLHLSVFLDVFTIILSEIMIEVYCNHYITVIICVLMICFILAGSICLHCVE